jgi:hypothetical protein
LLELGTDGCRMGSGVTVQVEDTHGAEKLV